MVFTSTAVPSLRLHVQDLPEAIDILTPGGVYALVVDTPPSRFPMLAACIGGALGQGLLTSLLLATPPQPWLERLAQLGLPSPDEAVQTGRLQVFSQQTDFTKKLFRHGTPAFVQELEYFGLPRDSLLVVDQADDLLSLHDMGLASGQAEVLSHWARAQGITLLLVFNRVAAVPGAAACLNGLMDSLRGIARLGGHGDGLNLRFDYWQSPGGTVAAKDFALSIQENGWYKIKATLPQMSNGLPRFFCERERRKALVMWHNMMYARVFSEMYFQADLTPALKLELRKFRDQTLRYQTLMQASNPMARVNSPRFRDFNLTEVIRRWEKTRQLFDADPQRKEWVHMYEQLDINVPPRTVVLTFDDGPHPVHTPAILDVLKRYKIKAMFFQLGSIFDGDYIGAENVKTRLAIQERLLAEGHVVANHTYSHPKLSTLSFEAAANEINAAQKFIAASAKGSTAQTRFFRPPYGDSDYKTLLAVDDARLYPLFWNIDSRDWEAKSPQDMVKLTVKVADDMDGGIVLLHDIHEVTARGLADLIEALRAKRFGFAMWNGQTFVRQAD